ncbi:hypothetical protein [Endozoicomonas ascidiicola]|uniref:hypothetical protein n=1 Tax=Endozoicomonas ascidiicola TaxID=1698521 RepID=UPI00082F506F|nr:hypothetical protein [Endozoicomonas ascidiicola]
MEPNKSKKSARGATFSLSMLAGSIIVALSSAGVMAADKDSRHHQIPYALTKENKNNHIDKLPSKACQEKVKKGCDHGLSVSESFKYHDQVACLDLGDPAQTDRLLQFIDLRIAERRLNEDVVVINEYDDALSSEVIVPLATPETSDTTRVVSTVESKDAPSDDKSILVTNSVIKSGKTIDETVVKEKPDHALLNRDKLEKTDQVTVKIITPVEDIVADQPYLEQDKEQDNGPTVALTEINEAPSETQLQSGSMDDTASPSVIQDSVVVISADKSPAKSVVTEKPILTEKDKEQARIDRAIARREERKRKIAESQKGNAPAEQSTITMDKTAKSAGNVIVSNPVTVVSETVPVTNSAVLSKKENTVLPEKRARSVLPIKPRPEKTWIEPSDSIAELPCAEEKSACTASSASCDNCDQVSGRPIAYQIANSEEDPRILNFDQSITQRFKSKGAYLDKGKHRDNVVKDKSGRDFLNVMAFWDVLVETQDDGEKLYYGNIQFPLGSRHPAIIKSLRSGDQLELGCRTDEVVVLKSFETEGVDYSHGLVDAYLAYSTEMPDGKTAYQEVVRQPAFSLINVESGCMAKEKFSKRGVDPDKMGNDHILAELPVRE